MTMPNTSNYNFFHFVNLAADPETNVVDKDSGQIIPGSEILDAFFDIRKINLGDKFNLDGDGYTFIRTTRDTRVGKVHNIVPDEDFYDYDGFQPSLVVDGTALEININPRTCRRYIIQEIGYAINMIQSILNTLNGKGWNLKLSVDPTVMLSEETLSKLPEQAAIFGCDADIDIYGKVADVAKIDAKTHPFRYAGGHIHMSFGATGKGSTGWVSPDVDTKEHRMQWFADNMYRLTTLYDRLIGIATTAINTSPLESMRRGVYGQAGRVRLQPYGGIEYRTPSTAWLLDSSMVSYTFLWAQVANNVIFQPELEERINSLYPIDTIVNVINSGDSQSALDILINTWGVLKDYTGLSQGDVHRNNHSISYAQYIYDKGGSHMVFDPDGAVSRWTTRGVLPFYGELSDLDTFVKKFIQ
jgi:hypothetical protein